MLVFRLTTDHPPKIDKAAREVEDFGDHIKQTDSGLEGTVESRQHDVLAAADDKAEIASPWLFYIARCTHRTAGSSFL